MMLRVENTQARGWYMLETANQNWSRRSLMRQIGVLYDERLLSSKARPGQV
jgi:predicted nuclease of restriction endonuclease-like (RecB) superfamily